MKMKNAAAVLLGALLLGPAMSAEAQGLITVTEMVAGRCAEMESSCEWRVSCRVGNGPDTPLVEYWKAPVGAKMDVKKVLDVPAFPASLNCRLEEDDGWFGTTWEAAETFTQELAGGGDFEFNLDSTAEGTVILKLRVASMEVNEPAPAAPAAAGAARAARTPAPARPRLYVGTFEPEEAGHAVVIGLPWEQFKARSDALAESGTKPTWLHSYEEGGTRYWSGVFHYYDGDYQFVHGLEWDPFFAKWKQITTNQGMRLTDFEMYNEKGKILCTGLFELGQDKHNLRIGLARQEMVNEVARMSARGLRLVDLEVYNVQGRTLYASAFRESMGGYGLSAGHSWDAFLAKAKATSGEGASFLDIESYMDGGRRLWDAVVTGRSGEMTPPLEAK